MRLADRVFAPHYAQAAERVLTAAATLRAGRDPGSEALADLTAGERFELLDLMGDAGWGVAPAHRLVGYLPADSLASPG